MRLQKWRKPSREESSQADKRARIEHELRGRCRKMNVDQSGEPRYRILIWENAEHVGTLGTKTRAARAVISAVL